MEISNLHKLSWPAHRREQRSTPRSWRRAEPPPANRLLLRLARLAPTSEKRRCDHLSKLDTGARTAQRSEPVAQLACECAVDARAAGEIPLATTLHRLAPCGEDRRVERLELRGQLGGGVGVRGGGGVLL